MKKRIWLFTSCVLILMTMLLLLLPACEGTTVTSTQVSTATATTTAVSTATTTKVSTSTATTTATEVLGSGTIKISYSCPKGKGYSAGEEWFAEEFPKRTNGRWKAEAYGASTLVPITAVLDSVREGVCQIGLTSSAQFAKDFPLTMVTQTMMYGWPSTAQTDGKWYDAAVPAFKEFSQIPEIAAELNNGFIYESNDLLSRSMIISKKKEIHYPSDLNGMKFGATGGFAELVKANGGATVAIVVPEVYMNLDKGVIEGAAASPVMITDWKLYNLVDYIYGIDMGTGNMLVLYNKEFYESLSPTDKKIFDDTRAEAWPICRDFMVGNDMKAFGILDDEGKTITEPTAAENEAWKKVVQDVWIPGWKSDAMSVGVSEETCDKIYKQWMDIRAKYWKQYNLPGEP